MEAGAGEAGRRSTVAAALPLAAAVFVFGTIFGAAAAPLIGVPLTLAASALIFSGAVQFAVVGLLLLGVAPAAMLLPVVLLNLRNLVLGAVMRTRIGVSRRLRAALAWFLVDETVGLALAAPSRPDVVLVTAGSLLYVGWLVGTAIGAVGGSLADLGPVAEAVFPVLFVGLAALSATRPDLVVRAVAAALFAAAAVKLWPGGRALVPVVVVVLVALPGRRT